MTKPHRSAASAFHPARLAAARHRLYGADNFVAAGAAYEDFLLRKERVYEAALASARSLAGELERSCAAAWKPACASWPPRTNSNARRAAGHPSAAGRRAAPAERGRLHAGPAGRAAGRQRHAQSRRRSAAPVRRGAGQDGTQPRHRHGRPCSAPPCTMSRCWPSAYPSRSVAKCARPVCADPAATHRPGAAPASHAGWLGSGGAGRRRLIVGRTREECATSASTRVPSLAAPPPREREGTLRSETKEGIPVLTAFSRSRDGRWTVAVGAPVRPDGGPVRSLIWAPAPGWPSSPPASGRPTAWRPGSSTPSPRWSRRRSRWDAARPSTPESRYSETAMLGRSLLHASCMLPGPPAGVPRSPDLAEQSPALCELAARALAAGNAAPGPPRCWRWTWITSRR